MEKLYIEKLLTLYFHDFFTSFMQIFHQMYRYFGNLKYKFVLFQAIAQSPLIKFTFYSAKIKESGIK